MKRKIKGKKRRKNRTSGRVRVEFITQKHPISGFVHYGSERINVMSFIIQDFSQNTGMNLYLRHLVLLVTRVIESSISLSYCKLCLITILPSKRMGFKPTHINFRVHVISYLTRLYMTQSHFSSVHQKSQF